MSERAIAVMLHPERPEALRAACAFVEALAEEGIRCLAMASDIERLRPCVSHADFVAVDGPDGAEMIVVFGGDGTILRAAAWALPAGVPLLGVNLGHVGFLAELEPSDLERLTGQVLSRSYEVEERFTLKITVADEHGNHLWDSFAINEVSLEKLARQHMLEVLVSIDERPLSLWSCDGVLVSTPTGSTAYAFSAGGPVIWPDVQGFLVVPLSAHALFSRPLVLGPDSTVELTLGAMPDVGGVLWCDGRRTFDMPPRGTARIVRGDRPLPIARLSEQPFTSRLVRKFRLPVEGWRTPREAP